LVWLTDDPGLTGQILTVIHSSNGALEDPIYAGTTTVGELTIADIDGNGLNDLVATRADEHMAQVLYHQVNLNPDDPNAMTFGLFSPVIKPEINAWAAPDLPDVYDSSMAVPAVAGGDIDGDGDDDLLFAGQPGCADRSLIWFGNGVDAESSGLLGTQNQAVKAWLWDADYADWCWPEVPTSGPDMAHLTLDPRSKPEFGPASTANKIRVTVWGRASGTGATGALTPLRLVDTFWDTNLLEIVVDIPLPTLVGDQPPRYLVIQVGYVEMDGSEITKVLPSWTGEIDCVLGIPAVPNDGPTTTGGVNQPPPPPSQPPPIP